MTILAAAPRREPGATVIFLCGNMFERSRTARRKWSRAEIGVLRIIARELPDSTIALVLGRSEAAIRAKRRRMRRTAA